jgi:ferredoxin, 2Fe-2S
MVSITFIRHDGVARTIGARGGMTLMEAAVAEGVDGIEAACGGACACATCHVHVAPEWLARIGAPNAMEAELLQTLDGVAADSRLACQVKVSEALDGLVVTTPAGQG